MDQNSKLMDRRQALQVIGFGLTAAGTLVACSGGGDSAAPAAAPTAAPAAPVATGCDAAAPIDETSKGLRRALQYKEVSPDPAKKCSNCVQFEAGKYGAECGGCKLFTGAVAAAGYCLSFAPLAAAVPAPGAPPAPGAAPAAPPTGTP